MLPIRNTTPAILDRVQLPVLSSRWRVRGHQDPSGAKRVGPGLLRLTHLAGSHQQVAAVKQRDAEPEKCQVPAKWRSDVVADVMDAEDVVVDDASSTRSH